MILSQDLTQELAWHRMFLQKTWSSERTLITWVKTSSSISVDPEACWKTTRTLNVLTYKAIATLYLFSTSLVLVKIAGKDKASWVLLPNELYFITNLLYSCLYFSQLYSPVSSRFTLWRHVVPCQSGWEAQKNVCSAPLSKWRHSGWGRRACPLEHSYWGKQSTG